MSQSSKDKVFPFRLQLAWGVAEVLIEVSLEGIVPSCFDPDPSVYYSMKTLPEDSGPHALLRMTVEKYEIVATAIILYGVPDILRIKNLENGKIVEYAGQVH